jgi:hypothetical protein
MESISLGVGVIGLITAIVQTVRIRSIRKIRDSHLNLIWANAKALSQDIILRDESERPRKVLGIRAQRLEESIALLITSLFNVTLEKIGEWRANGLIDDFDERLLRKLTRK